MVTKRNNNINTGLQIIQYIIGVLIVYVDPDFLHHQNRHGVHPAGFHTSRKDLELVIGQVTKQAFCYL
jgi:hypothetical protein